MLQSSIVSAEKVFVLLDTPVQTPVQGETFALPRNAQIEFEHVWFAYKPGQWVLRDLSFRVEPGETLAVVGHTGAGKTTILNLLLRFYEQQQGTIRMDGVDIRQISIPELRRQFGIVLQDSYVREGSILDNIKFGASDCDDAKVMEVAGQVGLLEMADHFPDGLQTRVQERGDNLSSGQKQILAFARALAHDPKYLILDEATSSVDSETERRIQQALDNVVSKRTSLVIAHRLATVLHANRILVMHKGRLAESGNHEELVAQKGLYWRLYQLQYEEPQPA